MLSEGEAPQEAGEAGSSSLAWHDYLEVVILIIGCTLGLVGNLAVLKVSLRIRTFSRQISLLFCGIICADILICSSRIPTTVYLIFSKLCVENGMTGVMESTTLTSTMALTNDLDGSSVSAAGGMSVSDMDSGMSGAGMKEVMSDKGEGHKGDKHDRGDCMDIDVACEVWAANNAIMITVIWLHLAVGVQRLAIIFSFSKYRKVFTQTFTGLLVLAAWVLGLVLVYTPWRALGMPMERAGRGACRTSDTTPDGLMVARSTTTALLCILPLLFTMGCYCVIMRSVWLAREVRTESATEYNRVVLVTAVRLLSLLLTYIPVSLLFVLDVKPGIVPNAAHRYVGHLLWLQSVLSPFVTLQDNDFREKLMVPKHAASPNGNGVQRQVQPGEGGVMPDIGSSGGQDGDEHRARNLEEMKKERQSRRSTFKRGLSFITSADMRTIRGSSE